MRMPRHQRLYLYLGMAALWNGERVLELFILPDTGELLADLLPRIALVFIASLLVGELVVWIAKTVHD